MHSINCEVLIICLIALGNIIILSSAKKVPKTPNKAGYPIFCGVAEEMELYILGGMDVIVEVTLTTTGLRVTCENLANICVLWKAYQKKKQMFLCVDEWWNFDEIHISCWLSDVSYALCAINQDIFKKQICHVNLYRWMPSVVFVSLMHFVIVVVF